ncbi:MAG: MBOAT family O-acyltransferase [Verrucomicrobiota bacterium]
MLFYSPIFLFIFLPVALIVFYAFAAKGLERISIVWLFLASLVFYGWWNPVYVPLILFSIFANLGLGISLLRLSEVDSRSVRRAVFWTGVSINLGIIGYWKYYVFVGTTFNQLIGSGSIVEAIVLPLAISFFTFQQIGFLTDVYRGRIKRIDALRYPLFVLFFPQLIAGPIVKYGQVVPQFGRGLIRAEIPNNLSVGLGLFVVGLFKKLVLADSLSFLADTVFDGAASGASIGAAAAFIGVFAYSFQLYFDFCGYSEMALGLGRMFGIRLPTNFRTPYRASSLSEFWRRWHITLSEFLKEHVYIAMGGNRNGRLRQLRNLWTTFILGGVWHGAGWTYLVWGALHGVLVCINHMLFWGKRSAGQLRSGWIRRLQSGGAWMLTFLTVSMCWIPFRADSLETAYSLSASLLNLEAALDGMELFKVENQRIFQRGLANLRMIGQVPDAVFGALLGVPLLIISLLIVLFEPDSDRLTRWLSGDESVESAKGNWLRYAVVGAVGFLVALSYINPSGSPFLYFQF